MFEDGNKWWMNRSEHGRKLLFSSPTLMWQAACEYFDYEDGSDYWKKRESFVWKGEILSETFALKSPFSWEKLCLFLDCSLSYFRNFNYVLRKRLKEKGELDEVDSDFMTVIERINLIITAQNLQGAKVGVFNANIVSRYLGISDNTTLSTPTNSNGQTNEDGSNTKEFKITLKLD